MSTLHEEQHDDAEDDASVTQNVTQNATNQANVTLKSEDSVTVDIPSVTKNEVASQDENDLEAQPSQVMKKHSI